MDNTERIVLVPRFTTFAGSSGTSYFYFRPINISLYAEAEITAFTGEVLGGASSHLDFHVQQSSDLEVWESIGSPLTDGDTANKEFDMAWLRILVGLVGTSTDAAATGWLVGEFVQRRQLAAAG